MNVPKKVGDLVLVSSAYGLHTYEDPNGHRFVVTAQQLLTWGKKVLPTTIRVHAQKRLSTLHVLK